MEKDIVLESRLVGTIKGDFFVPSYQRGYRWGKTEVATLMNDTKDKKTPLQVSLDDFSKKLTIAIMQLSKI